MNALVLCAGFGSRLGDLVEDCPKPLLSLGSTSIVGHILANLARAGVQDVWVNLHYLAEQFQPVLGDGRGYGVRIHYVYESSLRGTAGTARLIPCGDDGLLLVHYGDIVTDHSLAALRNIHLQRDALATILMHQRVGSNSRVWCREDGQVTQFEERPSKVWPLGEEQPFVYSGVCILSNKVIKDLPHTTPLDLPRDVFPELAGRGVLFGQRLDGYRWAIDSQERLAMARAYFMKSLMIPRGVE